MTGKLIERIIFIILILATFATIFSFSNQDGTESKSVSRKVMREIVDIYPGTNKLSEKEKNEIVEKMQPFIRKTAHFTIYMIAGIMIMGFISTFDLKWNKRIAVTLLLGVIYAISDEIHQGFTGGGRTPRIFDVCIDSLGVLTGAVIVLGILMLINYIKKARKKEVFQEI